MTAAQDLSGLFDRLRQKDRGRSEADIQADVRDLLLQGGLDIGEGGVRLETQVGDLRRIDVEVGFTVIEVKKNLGSETILTKAKKQLAGYVLARQEAVGQRYAALLTDGVTWLLFGLTDAALFQVARFELESTKDSEDALLSWLDGALATVQNVPAVPAEIVARLGIGSSAHALDVGSISMLYEASKDLPTVKLKRDLWASLLGTAMGTQFSGNDELFVAHTLLVNMAEIIAHAVVGIDVRTTSPASLLRGGTFETARITGVVEADFFDWVLEVEGGAEFVRALAKRLSRFEWAEVEQDVMKVIYESVISVEVRKALGEYYTPDWLAEAVVHEVQNDPLNQRVLDPSCGSGTFLFHSVRRYLDSATDAGVALADALDGLSNHVVGMDLHPVAVALARVTYLLAIGTERLQNPKRGPISIPVFLGDSLQWDQRRDLLSSANLTVSSTAQNFTGQGELVPSDMMFPMSVVDDASTFDQLVRDMSQRILARTGSEVPSLEGTFNRLGLSESERPVVTRSFETMCRLHDDGRDHIWGYYIRNLIRPTWMSQRNHRVDLLLGNPPWLAYRHMSKGMQKAFKELSESRNLWAGKKNATHQDLSALFIARSAQLYLRDGGRLAFVVPSSVLDREHYEGFRKGRFPDEAEPVGLDFQQPWDLSRLRPHFFPRAAAVVFATRVDKERSRALPTEVQRWLGRLDNPNPLLQKEPATVVPMGDAPASVYAPRFRQGAAITPRVLLFVEQNDSQSQLGQAAGSSSIRSGLSSYEKKPWKDLDRLEGVVENEFLRRVYVGASVLPFRTLEPATAVIPWDGSKLLNKASHELDLHPGLADWWRSASGTWEMHRANSSMSLSESLDYMGKLSAQYPIPSRRVVYTSSGMHVSAALVEDGTGLIDNSLYWATVRSADEGNYLLGVLNAPVITELCRPMMAYGKDERHIHKTIWRLMIPEWDVSSSAHRLVAELAAESTTAIADLTMDADRHFVALRKDVRSHLAVSGLAERLNDAVSAVVQPGDSLD